MDDKDLQQRMQQVESLLRRLEDLPDPATRAAALELVSTLMEFHGAGLERMMEFVAEAGEPGYAVFERFAGDDLVGSLLLLYGLHPLTLTERVTRALDQVRPYLDSHGGNVELLSVADGLVRLRLQGSCKTCPSSAMTLKLAIEEAIYKAAPDVTAIEAEGVTAPPPMPTGFVQIGQRGDQTAAAHTQPAAALASGNGHGWTEVDGLLSLAHSTVRTLEVQGRPVLFCRLGETFYAYGAGCPGCNQPLDGAQLALTNLACPNCGGRYDMIRAGRGLDQPSLHLEPFPLLVEQGRAKVALPQLAAP